MWISGTFATKVGYTVVKRRALLMNSQARKSMETKPGSMRDKEVDTNKKTIRRRQMTHQRGPSNTGSLRTPKKSSNSISTERGWSAVKSLPSRKYDIATLMAIGKNGGMNSIVAKFSSHSVESKLFHFLFKAFTTIDYATMFRESTSRIT